MTTPKAPADRYKSIERAKAEDLPEALNTDDIAALTGLGVNRVRDLVAAGVIPAYCHRPIRAAKRAVMRWMEGGETDG